MTQENEQLIDTIQLAQAISNVGNGGSVSFTHDGKKVVANVERFDPSRMNAAPIGG